MFWLTPDTYRTGSGAQNLSVGTDPLTANTYTYVNGDPINLSDPTGHGCIDYGPCGQRPVRKLSRDAYQIITDFHAKRTPKQYQKAGRAFSNYEIDKIMAAWETACARWKCPSGNEIIEWAFRGRADMESRKTHLPGWRTVVETVGIIPGIDTIADAVLCANSAFKRNAGGIAVDCGMTLVPFASAGAVRTGKRIIGGLDNAPTGAADDLAGAVCSFDGDTEVLMADGTTKPIDDVEVGDMVLAEDPETGERGPRRVTHVWVHDDILIDLEIDGDIVTTTEDHPFWNHTDGQWQRADALDGGDLVVTADGGLLIVGGLSVGSEHNGRTYNLTVDGIHTYFVEVGDEAVLVHNTCNWGNPSTLDDHFNRHGPDFGAPSADSYGRLADEFFQSRGQYLTKVDPNTGVTRVYDPVSNTFGSYNPSGTTKTFYKPDPAVHGYPTNWDYWTAQPG